MSSLCVSQPAARRHAPSTGHHNYLISTEHISVDSVYQEQRVYGPVAHSQDPVFNHGRQFRDWHTLHRKQLDSQDPLGRAFLSWPGRGEGACVPVNSAVIDSLKRMTRLLHYCSSPILMHHPHGDQTTMTSASPTSIWYEAIQVELLKLYLKYLGSLGFQDINERTSSKRKATGHKHQSTQKLYKCMQRSWAEGIVMVEVLFQGFSFVVKLYTLELSRLQKGAEFNPSFSRECTRYKDFTHVRSFMHDFNLYLLLDLLVKTRNPPFILHLGHFMSRCHAHNTPPPNYVKNFLTKGQHYCHMYVT